MVEREGFCEWVVMRERERKGRVGTFGFVSHPRKNLCALLVMLDYILCSTLTVITKYNLNVNLTLNSTSDSGQSIASPNLKIPSHYKER